MVCKNWVWIFLFIIVGGFINSGIPQQSVILTEAQDKYPLGSYLEILEDPGGKLTIQDVSSQEYHSHFILSKEEVPNYGYTHSTYWVRFKISDKRNNFSFSYWVLELGNALVNYVELYQMSSEGEITTKKRTGSMLPSETRDLNFNHIIFLLTIPKKSDQTFYLRFQNEDSMLLPLTLYSMKAFITYSRIYNLMMGILIGILLLMMGYNAFVYLSLRDRSYLYFIIFIGCFLLFIIAFTGMASLYLWPNFILWNRYSIILFLVLMIISLLKFTEMFLQAKTRLKWSRQLMNFLLLFIGMFFILIPFARYSVIIKYVPMLVIFYSLFFLIAGYISWRGGYRPAGYFLASIVLFVLNAITLSLLNLGYLKNNVFTASGYLFASIPFVWLLSRALSDRVKLLMEEKDRADKHLSESEASLQAFINAIPEPAFLIDKAKNFIVVNKSLAEGFNKSMDEIIGQNAFSFLPQDIAEQQLKKFEQTYKTGKPTIFEDSRDGRDHINYIYPVKDEKGSISRTAVFALDITERKRAEKIQQVMFNIANAVSKTENLAELYEVIHSQLNRLIDAKNFFVGIYEKDSDTILLPYMKDEKMTAERIPAVQTISSIVIKNNQSMLLKEKDLLKLQKKGKIGKGLTSPCKIWVGVPLQTDGDVIGILVIQSYENENAYNESDLSLMEFVAKQVAVSIKKKQVEDRIRIFSRSIEQSPVIVMITDLKGNIEYVNPKFVDVTGYSFDEVKGKNPRFLKSDNTPQATYKQLWETIKSGKEWSGEFYNKKKNGKFYWELAYISPIKNEKDEITHFLAVKEDITEQIRLRQQLVQSQKMESIGTLAGGIAHDFNNLLTVITGYSDLALIKLDKNNPIRKDITAIQSAGLKAENLTRQILAFSRKQILHSRIIDINNVISDLEKLIRRLISEDIGIKMNLPPNLPRINADPGQIEQIIINLVVNARDAINQNSKKVIDKKITIETGKAFLDESYVAKHVGSRTGLHVYISLSDTGIGMTDDVKQKVFEPFFTTKGKGEGTGLGLSTVYGIVKQNKGSIYIYSEAGEGTTFKIYWPSSDEELSQDVSQDINEDKLRGSENILFVEDDKEVRDFACTSLKNFGYQIHSASNGKKALKVIREKKLKVDLLITDWIMPDMNGKELSQNIQEILPEVSVIFTSGYSNGHIVNAGELSKDISFLQKPYSVHALLNKVREVLDKK